MTIPLPMEAMLGPDRVRQRSAYEPTGPLGEALAAAQHISDRRIRLLQADVERIADAAGYTLSDVRSRTRTAELVEVRRIIVRYLRAQDPPVSWPAIGRVINRDHTSAMHLLSPRRLAQPPVPAAGAALAHPPASPEFDRRWQGGR
jgi:Bacterial dnaA protein helix-turn-helix